MASRLTSPTCLTLTQLFHLGVSVLVISTQNQMANNKGITITQRENFSYLGKYEMAAAIPITATLFSMEIQVLLRGALEGEGEKLREAERRWWKRRGGE